MKNVAIIILIVQSAIYLGIMVESVRNELKISALMFALANLFATYVLSSL